jgi:elongation factor G
MTMTTMYVPKPCHLAGHRSQGQQVADGHVQSAQSLFEGRSDLQTHVDPETNETIIEGMGELHLDIYV